MKLLLYNYAAGIDGGMEFISKSMQHFIERYIQLPQKEERLPTQAVVFEDISNIFRSVSHKELIDIIGIYYSKPPPVHFLCGSPGSVHHCWEDWSLSALWMLKGVNQGCPLSAIFAALVLD